MGLLDSLNMGANAMLTHQAALQVTGHNIANVATPGYTRQEAVLSSVGSTNLAARIRGGNGVTLDRVRQIVDQSLQERLRDAQSQMTRYRTANEALAQVEQLMNEMTDNDISSAMVELFNSFSALGQQADSDTLRGGVLTDARTLVRRFQDLSVGLQDLRDQFTGQLEDAVVEAGQLADQIAEMNQKVVTAEAGGKTAADLRDKREQLISKLSELVTVTVREDDAGNANVFIGSEPLVTENISRGLAMVDGVTSDGETHKMVAFDDNDGRVELLGGTLMGLQETRDGELVEIVQRLDTLAGQLIWQVNRQHSQGTGLTGVTEVIGTYAVDDPDAALNSADAGLTFPPSNGSFLLHVSSGPADNPSTRTVKIDVPLTGGAGDMTLNDLIGALNAVEGVNASVGASGRLELSTDSRDVKLSFTEDSSGVLASLGINTFFDGYSASTIRLNDVVANDRGRIAAGTTGLPGDGSNALTLGNLGDQPIAGLGGGASLLEYQQQLTADTAAWAAAARDTAEANEVVYEGVLAQRESLSGVSLDDEAVNLMRHQRAFQGAARFISIVDQMLDEVIRLL